MDLGNPIEIVVYHLLIEGIVCLSHRYEFLMVATNILNRCTMISHGIETVYPFG